MSEQNIIKDEKGKRFIISMPPNQVFLYNHQGAGQNPQQMDALALPAHQEEIIPQLDLEKGINGVTYPETGGQYVWHLGRDYPRKGHVYPQALKDIYYPKRILINCFKVLASKDMFPFFLVFGLLPKKIKGRILNRCIDGYLDIANGTLNDHYLHPQFNTDICRELTQPIMTFMTELGIENMRAAKMSLVFITILEYDMAYRLRIEDLLSETTKEKVMADPVGEAQRLIKILAERDKRTHLIDKFDRFAKLLKYGFFFVKKPFRKALSIVNFSKLQLDDIDRYQVRHWTGYNWFGMTIQERVAKWPPKATPAFKLVPDTDNLQPVQLPS